MAVGAKAAMLRFAPPVVSRAFATIRFNARITLPIVTATAIVLTDMAIAQRSAPARLTPR